MNMIAITQKVCLLMAAALLAPTLAPAQEIHIAWIFGDVGLEAYQLDGFEPNDIEFAPLGSTNPTLPLELGRRYQVTVTDYGFHPLEIIAKGAAASQDQVLLSMTVQGPFESDPEVAWVDDGQGTIAFTLTESLYQAMAAGGRRPGYRCRTHPTTMRGDFTVAGLPIAERIARSPVRVALEPVASGLTAPNLLVPDPSLRGRLYVVDQPGQIYAIDHGELVETPFLDVSDLLVPLRENFDERGLLGVAFHPGYTDANNLGHGRFYTYTSEPWQGPADFTVDLPAGAIDHQSVLREWQVEAVDQPVDPTTSREVMRIDQPQFNHNGGHIEFGPDGYLYIALGDGGGANDTSAGHGPIGNGQNIHTILGSIARIDPLHPDLTPGGPDAVSANGAYRVPADNPFVGVDGVDEIYAYGLRNPYRFSFDRRSGALIAADVGQGLVEEINFIRKGGNYGWNLKEGTFLFDPAGVQIGLPLDDPTLIDPVVQYDHDDGIAVIGGYAYYGTGIPELWGRYIFGDWSQSFSTPGGRLFEADLFTGKMRYLSIAFVGDPLPWFVKGFGQDAEGEIYLLGNTDGGPIGETGVVFKIVAAPPIGAVLTGTAAGTDSKATGLTILRATDRGTLTFELGVQALENVTQAHIHVADEPGGQGPPVVWLYPLAPPPALIPGEVTGQLGAGEITDADLVGPLAGMTLADLLAAIDEGRAYVNVHTEKYPAGEIDGTLE